MIRRALIIYCDNTGKKVLPGPPSDNYNYRKFLESNTGGYWYRMEIHSLHSPTVSIVKQEVKDFLSEADYTFIIFTGHGYIDKTSKIQHIEVADGNISVLDLKTNAPRQTLIVDACRGFYTSLVEETRVFSKAFEQAIGNTAITRQIFTNAVLQAEEGWSILFSANENQSSIDTDNGGAYLLSLLKSAESWAEQNNRDIALRLDVVHELAIEYIRKFETTQTPVMRSEKRKVYFPFAVKTVLLHG